MEAKAAVTDTGAEAGLGEAAATLAAGSSSSTAGGARTHATELNAVIDNDNSGIAKHYFCKTCGIKPFYIPRSNPDGIDVNVNCLEEAPAKMRIVNFDGLNWEANAHKLAHKSKPN